QVGRNPIILSSEGLLRGRLWTLRPADGQPLPAAGTDVFAIQDSRIIGRATSDEQGVFGIGPVAAPGVVSLVAVGQGGFGIFAVATAPPDKVQAHRGRGESGVSVVPVRFVQPAGGEPVAPPMFESALAGSQDRGILNTVLNSYGPNGSFGASPFAPPA